MSEPNQIGERMSLRLRRILGVATVTVSASLLPLAAQAHGPTPWLYNFQDWNYTAGLCIYVGSYAGVATPAIKSHYADGHQHLLSPGTCR
jgi:hypothetical protein